MIAPKLYKEGRFDEFSARNINVIKHPELPLAILDYSIDSPRFDSLVEECRGLVVGPDGLVARAFSRFYNWGEAPHIQQLFDWDKVTTYEKLDGSLILLYYYEGWRVNTRGSFGQGFVTNFFGQTSKKTWESLVKELINVNPLDKSICYVCELVGPENRVVKLYEKPALYLIGAFQGEIEIAVKEMKWPGERTNTYPLRSYDDVVDWLDSVNNSKSLDEGFVVHDGNNRFKFKNKFHFTAAKVRTGINETYFVEQILNGNQNELLTYFPELSGGFEVAVKQIERLKDEVDAAWKKHYQEGITKKDFAASIQKEKNKTLLFIMFDKVQSFGSQPPQLAEHTTKAFLKKKPKYLLER